MTFDILFKAASCNSDATACQRSCNFCAAIGKQVLRATVSIRLYEKDLFPKGFAFVSHSSLKTEEFVYYGTEIIETAERVIELPSVRG